MMRRRLIAGNWKMYKIQREALEFAGALGTLVAERADEVSLAAPGSPEVVICAPFTILSGLSMLAAMGVGIGAQTMHEAVEGAYTGEISARMLQDVDCTYVILGHSERRAYCNETDAAVARKSLAALAAGIAPIVCVGESLAEREAGRTHEVIANQMAPVLAGLSGYAATEGRPITDLVVAYEPIWAIGTGRSSTSADAQAVIGAIRRQMVDVLGVETAKQIRILYGGSVKPDNIAAYLAEEDIDGALVGGASLQAESFAELLTQSVYRGSIG